MSVRPVSDAETFWTIMSMLISARATAWKISAAMPARSGTPTTVILASLRSCATPAMIGASTGSPSGPCRGLSVIQVPSCGENDERTWIGMSKRRAYSTQRRCRILAPHAAISSISSLLRWWILRALATIRGSAVKTPSTSL